MISLSSSKSRGELSAGILCGPFAGPNPRIAVLFSLQIRRPFGVEPVRVLLGVTFPPVKTTFRCRGYNDCKIQVLSKTIFTEDVGLSRRFPIRPFSRWPSAQLWSFSNCLLRIRHLPPSLIYHHHGERVQFTVFQQGRLQSITLIVTHLAELHPAVGSRGSATFLEFLII